MQADIVHAPAARIGARVLLLDGDNQILLIHARDPDERERHWWELPGGGVNPGEALIDTARRELAEETGIVVDHVGRHLWDRETSFRYRNRQHHRRERVFLARTGAATPTVRTRHTANEKAGLIEYRWWTQRALADCRDTLLPPNLAALLAAVLDGRLHEPLVLDA